MVKELPLRALRFVDSLLGRFAALILLGMMLLTLADVIGRSGFNNPVPGAFELTELLLLAVVFAGLPQTCRTNDHISVSILIDGLPSRVKAWLQRLFAGIGAVVMGALAWSMAGLGFEKIRFHDVTSFLGIPIGPIALAASLLLALSALAEAARAVVPDLATAEGSSSPEANNS